ncbi:TPA: D-tyrosyl-tRNA(Tyr) deacylase [Vibrio vulnificus]|nr:D-tyrosyl-tRNA(Tyr) deacylase [Vibrio vulnificus]
MRIEHGLILLLTANVLVGCGGGGGGSSAPAVVKPSKQYRAPLESLDLTTTYVQSGEIVQPQLFEVKGDVAFELIGEESAQVVLLDSQGRIKVLKPGVAHVKAIDTSDTFQTSESNFTITIQKGWNDALSISPLYLTTTQSTPSSLTVRGAKGELSYRVLSDPNAIIDLSAQGEVQSRGRPGIARIQVIDLGDEFYSERSVEADVIVRAVDADSLSFAALSRAYQPGLVLAPKRLDTTPTERIVYQIVKSEPDWEVAEFSQQNQGMLAIKNSGKVTVQATAYYPETYKTAQQTSEYEVTIDKAARQPLSVANMVTEYQANARLQPVVSNAKGEVQYRLLSGADVLHIDTVANLPVIDGVGQAEVEVTEQNLRNYQASSARFTIQIDKAPHQGIKQDPISLTYQQDLRIPFEFAGQKGRLTLVSGSSPQLALVEKTLFIKQAGQYSLQIEDDGGELYQSTQFTLSIDVAKAAAQPYQTQDYQETYYKDLQINLQQALNPRTVLNNSDPSVVKVLDGGILHVLKAGETRLTIRRAETNNYLAGPVQYVNVRINSADSQLKAAQPLVEGTWTSAFGSIGAPLITGAVGKLSYYLAEGEPTDVVALDKDSGFMKMLNAGSVRVIVKDTGSSGVNAGETSFTARVLPADNPVEIHYPNTIFEENKTIVPSLSLVMDKRSYRLINQADPTVKLTSSTEGAVSMLHAGSFEIEATVSARNYKTVTKRVTGTISKAAAKALDYKPQSVDFVPFKQVSLAMRSPIGTRSYKTMLSDSTISVDPISGVITLKDYLGDSQDQVASIVVSEDETRDYLALSQTSLNFTLNAPKKEQADSNHTLTEKQTVIISKLSGSAYAKLQEAQFGLMGVDRQLRPTDEQFKSYGEGMIAIVRVKPIGSDVLTERRKLMLHIARFDDCANKLDQNNLAPFEAVSFDAQGYCQDGSATLRMTRVTVVDDTHLEKQAYELVRPMIFYRKGERRFLPESDGGRYPREEEVVSSLTYGDPRTLYEWVTLQFHYQPE